MHCIAFAHPLTSAVRVAHATALSHSIIVISMLSLGLSVLFLIISARMLRYALYKAIEGGELKHIMSFQSVCTSLFKSLFIGAKVAIGSMPSLSSAHTFIMQIFIQPLLPSSICFSRGCCLLLILHKHLLLKQVLLPCSDRAAYLRALLCLKRLLGTV